MIYCFLVVFIGFIFVARGLALSSWVRTLLGLVIVWVGTFMMIVTLDLIAIGVTVKILSEPSPFDLEIIVPDQPKFTPPGRKPKGFDKEA